MIIKEKKTEELRINLLYVGLLVCVISFNFSCSKQEPHRQRVKTTDSAALQVNYLVKIKNSLKDSLSANDFSSLDFSKVYKSKDVGSKNYFLRLSVKGKKISHDFILLKTDIVGNILKGRILQVKFNGNKKSAASVTVITSFLNRKETKYLKNTGQKPRAACFIVGSLLYFLLQPKVGYKYNTFHDFLPMSTLIVFGILITIFIFFNIYIY